MSMTFLQALALLLSMPGMVHSARSEVAEDEAADVADVVKEAKMRRKDVGFGASAAPRSAMAFTRMWAPSCSSWRCIAASLRSTNTTKWSTSQDSEVIERSSWNRRTSARSWKQEGTVPVVDNFNVRACEPTYSYKSIVYRWSPVGKNME